MPLDKKKKICKFSFDGEGNHIALTHKLQGYSANNRPDPLIVKADEVVFNEEILKDLLKVNTKQTEGEPSNVQKGPTKGSQQKEKSTGDKMDKVEIEKAQLDQMEKAAAQAAEQVAILEKKLKDQEEALIKAAQREQEALIKEKVSIVKALGFVSEEVEQVSLATALVKAAAVDLDGAKAIEQALEKAKLAVEAAVSKEIGHNEEIQETSVSAGVLKAVRTLNKKQ